MPQRRLRRRQQNGRLVCITQERRSLVRYGAIRSRAKVGSLLGEASMQLNRNLLERIEYAVVGALAALGAGLLVYAFAGHLVRAWQWLAS